MSVEVVSDVGRFAMVPVWVIEACRGNPTDLVVFTVLAAHADRSRRDDWVMSRQQIADEAGLSLSSVKRALPRLVEVGAVTIEHRGVSETKQQLPSRYVVHFRCPQGWGHDEPRGGVTEDLGSPVNRGGVTSEPRTQSPYTESFENTSAVTTGVPPDPQESEEEHGPHGPLTHDEIADLLPERYRERITR